MEGLLTQEIKTSLENIVKQCFENNRIADRIMSLINVKFVMPSTEKILHPGYAHLMPAIADVVTDYMAARDCTVIYGETSRGDQEYDSPLDCFRKLLEINLTLETLTKETITLSLSQGDLSTKVKMEEFLLKLIPVTSDLLVIVDKGELYNNLESPMDWMNFDRDIHNFGVFSK